MTDVAQPCANGCLAGHYDDCTVKTGRLCLGCKPRPADVDELCLTCWEQKVDEEVPA